MLYDEAAEEWYAQRDPDEVEREESNCMRIARKFCSKGPFPTNVVFQSPTRSVAAHLGSYLLHTRYTSVLADLYNDATKDQLECDWITWQRDYALNKTWGDSRN